MGTVFFKSQADLKMQVQSKSLLLLSWFDVCGYHCTSLQRCCSNVAILHIAEMRYESCVSYLKPML